MLRILNADKVNGVVAIGMGEKDLRNLIESVDNMVEKQQRTFLEKQHRNTIEGSKEKE
jgi:hypothetical protein